jgi:hypothetical protein
VLELGLRIRIIWRNASYPSAVPTLFTGLRAFPRTSKAWNPHSFELLNLVSELAVLMSNPSEGSSKSFFNSSSQLGSITERNWHSCQLPVSECLDFLFYWCKFKQRWLIDKLEQSTPESESLAASLAAFVASATCNKAVWSMSGSTPDISHQTFQLYCKSHLKPLL